MFAEAGGKGDAQVFEYVAGLGEEVAARVGTCVRLSGVEDDKPGCWSA
jgi:hypothetical protein